MRIGRTGAVMASVIAFAAMHWAAAAADEPLVVPSELPNVELAESPPPPSAEIMPSNGAGPAEAAELAERAMVAALDDLGTTTTGLDLHEAILRALESNTGLAVARLNPPIASSRVLSARGVFDAIVTADANYGRQTVQSEIVGGTLTQVNRNSGASVGVAKPFATGTQLGFSANLNRTSDNFSPTEYFTSVAFTARQALLRGLNPKANLAGIRQAENNFRSSLYQLEADAINTVADVETTYWDLALAYELLGTQRFSLDLAERLLERTRAFVEVGGMSPLEITTAEAEVASRRRDTIEARNNLQITAIDLLRLIEPELAAAGPAALPKPTTEADLREPAITRAQSVEIALRKRPDLAQAHLDFENGELRVIQTRDGLLPRLDLVGSYGVAGRGDSTGDSLSDLGDGDSDQYSIGLEFDVPLPNRRARGEYRGAQYSRDQLQLSINNLRETIKANTLKARIDHANRIAGVEASRAALRLQEEKLHNEEEKWKNGLSTSLDVFQAQRDLVRARNQLLTDIANALKSETNVLVQEGTLLEARGLAASGGEALK